MKRRPCQEKQRWMNAQVNLVEEMIREKLLEKRWKKVQVKWRKLVGKRPHWSDDFLKGNRG